MFRGRAQWHKLQCAGNSSKCPAEGMPLSDPIWDNVPSCSMLTFPKHIPPPLTLAISLSLSMVSCHCLKIFFLFFFFKDMEALGIFDQSLLSGFSHVSTICSVSMLSHQWCSCDYLFILHRTIYFLTWPPSSCLTLSNILAWPLAELPLSGHKSGSLLWQKLLIPTDLDVQDFKPPLF